MVYSKTSLNRPFVGVNSCSPFREVVDLQSFPKYRKDVVVLISIMLKASRSVKVVGMAGFRCVRFLVKRLMLA